MTVEGVFGYLLTMAIVALVASVLGWYGSHSLMMATVELLDREIERKAREND